MDFVISDILNKLHNVNNLDLDSVIQCLYLINNLRESLINLLLLQT